MANGVAVENAADFVRNDDRSSIRAKGETAWDADWGAGGDGGVADGLEHAVVADVESEDASGGDRAVEHVQEVAMHGDGQRLVTRIDDLLPLEARAIDLEDSDLVVTRADAVEVFVVLAQHQATLGIEVDTNAVAAGRE